MMQYDLMSWARWLRTSRKASRGPHQTARGGRARYQCRVEPLEARCLPSANLVVDLNPATQSSGPINGTAVGDAMFFLASDGIHGYELWYSDGTAKGTHLVKDIRPGPDSPFNFPSRPVVAGDGRLFFTADDGVHGEELWTSDGTEKGTFLVKDIRPGSASPFSPEFEFRPTLVYWSGAVYFGADDGEHGSELWRSDGTAKGTAFVLDLVPGPAPSFPFHAAVGDGAVFYTASHPATGRELWRTDGTEKGTTLVKDIWPGQGSAFNVVLSPPTLLPVGGALFFGADDGATGRELWRSDGTAKGTALVKDIYPGPEGVGPVAMTNAGGTLLFSAYEPATGTELWRSDGTAKGTVLVTELVPGSGSAPLGALTPVGGLVFFVATVPGTGRELWRTDGTEKGTALVKDIFPGAAGSSPAGLTEFNGTLFFAAEGPGIGRELWSSDGTDKGTALVQDFLPGIPSSEPHLLGVGGGRLFFGAAEPGLGTELWTSDGTAKGTRVLADINPFPADSDPDNWVAFNGLLFFAADTLATGIELWKTDGTAEGTALVRDINPGRFSSRPSNLAVVGDTLFFSAMTQENGNELWKTDGTAEGTVLVRDLWQFPQALSSNPTWLTNVNGILYFSAEPDPLVTDPGGRELWRSDGTAEGTFRVRDINPGRNGSNPNWMHNVNGQLIFIAFHRDYGAELWTSDGTQEGTILLKDIWPGTAGFGTLFFPLTTVLWDGILYLPANDGVHGYELWRTDGTEEGTMLVKDIRPGSAGMGPYNLRLAGGALFFTANDGTHGRELWKSDGTEKGTALVKDVFPGGTGAFSDTSFVLSSMVVVNGRLFFVAADGVHGHELWQSDGTEEGTTLVRDIRPGAAGAFQIASPGPLLRPNLTGAHGLLYFAANDGKTGRELWRSDGTAKGTVRDTDIYPGAIGSDPLDLVSWQDWLFFSADDGVYGREVWAVAPGSSPGGGAPGGFADLPPRMHLIDDFGQGDIAGILARQGRPLPHG